MANILSLFDGMACGHIAMEQADIPVDSYIAYEIDKYAIQTATHNFPDIEEKGDVFDADFTEYRGQVDYLIGGSPCFTKGHYVLTINGYKDISDIEIGDMVLTHKNRYKPVTRLYKRVAPTTQVKITGYDTITTTDNHPFYSVQRSKNSYKEYKKCHSWRKFSEPTWTKVFDMNKDTMCGMHINDARPVDTYYDLDNETMWLLGRYVADGHIRKTKRPERKDSYQYQFIISCGENKIDDFKSAIKNHHYSCFSHSTSTYRCVFSSMDLVNFVIDNKFGRSASTKRIPEFIYSMPAEKKKAFLDGYMSGDGCFLKDSNGYCATTVSKELAIGLQRLITQIYKTNVGICKNDNNRPHFIDGREINPNFPLYTVLFKESIRKQSVAHIKDDIVWTAFKSKHPTGKTETVYNIEVADDNSYTINNLIVHNCTYWSIAQTNNRETEASGLGWELLSQFVRALIEAEPKYFLYENNKSMSKAIRESITETFGFEPICINSALVSGQNRQRLYWVGKREADGTYSKVQIEQPEDRGILLKDILETGCTYRDMAAEPVVGYDLESVKPLEDQSDNNNAPIRLGTIASNVKNKEADSQPYRVYSPNGKSVTICGSVGSMGKNTGLYAVPCECNCYATPCEWNDDGEPIKATSCADGKTYTVYKVADGQITIKGKTYPIKLVDGFYIIRKLTVRECARLQQIPEWIEFPCSDSQSYKQIGNGWSICVIEHLLRATKE